MDKLLNDITEDATASAIPANVMGTSSSTPGTGAIDTYDPLLKKKKNLRSIVLKRKTLQDLKNGNG
jgi:hypothetical protein